MTTGRCEMDNREIGTRIRLARRDAGLTQEKLAEKIGVSTVFVSQLESGSRAPGLETLVKLSQTLHVSLDLLVLGGAPGGDAEACLAALVHVSCIPAYICRKSAIVPGECVDPSQDTATAEIPTASELP